MIVTFGWITEFDRNVNGPPCIKLSFVSFAQILFVCNRNLGSGNDDFDGDDDFEGDAEDLLTGLFVGEGILKSITTQHAHFRYFPKNHVNLLYLSCLVHIIATIIL